MSGIIPIEVVMPSLSIEATISDSEPIEVSVTESDQVSIESNLIESSIDVSVYEGLIINVTAVIDQSSPISVTLDDASVNVTLETSAIGQVLLSKYKTFQELTPAPDGVNKVFTAPSSFHTGTSVLFRDGSVLMRGIDYTESDADAGEITLTDAPFTDEDLRINYIES